MLTLTIRRTIYIVVAIMVILAALVVVLAALREPEYQGKTVREWVWDYALTNRQGFHEPPTTAMQYVGPRAVPLLVTELQRQNSDLDKHRLKFRLWFAAPDWISQKMQWREPPFLGDAYMLRESAAIILGSLGTQARPAIPSLRAALGDPTPHVRLQAAYTLWQIDHSLAAEVVPILMELHTNQYNFKYYICLYFGSIGEDARAAVPLVREALNDSNPNIRRNAERALKRLEPAETRGQDANH
jgi:hypothetical protein